MLMKSLERAKKGDKGLQIATSAAEAFDSMEGDNKVRRAARQPMARKHALIARFFALQDDFNMLFRELAFEMKGKATDRLKTPEEIAKEEKERLEQLEVPATTPRACRVRRIRPLTSCVFVCPARTVASHARRRERE
jgi:hypothetical protein